MGSAAHWGPSIAQSCASLKPVCPPDCILHTFLLHALFSPSSFIVAAWHRLSVVHCNLAQYWPKLWLMPCCSVPGTWTGTDTPGDMSPERKRDRDSFNYSSFQQAVSDYRQIESLQVLLPVLELAEDGVCRWGEEYADESKLRGADGDGGNMQE